jgi:phosphoribosylamine--glycine ligase
MKILVLGSGGREHALVWKLAQSPRVAKLYAMPGNPGMAEMADLVAIPLNELDRIVGFAEQNQIDLTVVGPEAPLAAGIVDLFRQRGLKIFGPARQAAQLESSKSFAKNIMQKYGIPTADYRVFTHLAAAQSYVRREGVPIVIKADGLAAGKGVTVAVTLTEALAALDRCLGSKEFGAAGARVLIEEYLEGEEVSILAFADGETVVPMLPAQDHKRVYDNDQGANTGGMGAYAPAPIAGPDICQEAMEKILQPTLAALRAEGCPYQGCLYAGLMATKSGLKVIEFNVRFGDPETQVIMPLLESDLAEILLACAEGRLRGLNIDWKPQAAVCVVVASGGYPGAYADGLPIRGLAAASEKAVVFQAGTRLFNGRLLTAGGRVLGVTACAGTIQAAQAQAYQAVELIEFDKMHYRSDIAWRAVKTVG